jgi:dCMP deaminase
MEKDNKWNIRFMRLANEIATWSKDPNKKVGAVLISPDRKEISYGYNGFPSKLKDDERLRFKRMKNNISIHAEQNAILNSKKNLIGWSLYVNTHPCTNCALHIIQAGITKVVTFSIDASSSWTDSCKYATHLFKEAGIEVIYMKEEGLCN